MTDSQIDEAILSVAEHSWRKVAMVVGRTTRALGDDRFGDSAMNSLVAKRIEALVDAGCLVAQGDIKKWRYSEVRKP